MLIFFTHRLSNKHFLIWLLTTPPHLKYVATLPCNLLLMACFGEFNVSQGSVATYARCPFNCKFTKESSSDNFLSVKIRQNYGHESVAPFLKPTLYIHVGLRTARRYASAGYAVVL